QPIGALLGSERVRGSSDLHLGGTFAWVPAAAAGALASIDQILSDGVLDNVMELERIAVQELAPTIEEFEQVGDVRAAGALVGIEFVTDESSIVPARGVRRSLH